MLKSLFGDLTPPRDRDDTSRSNGHGAPRGQQEPDFASTAIMGHEEDAAETAEDADRRHHDDLLVSGSPAQAMRAHFASSRKDTFLRQKLITMCDPSHMWAASVIRALADASGQPIERLSLRDQASLNLMATIERTTLPRRTDDTLKIYHADIQAEGDDAAEVQMALMERSDLSVVIIGPMAPSAIDDMLADLHSATLSLHWQCRNLLFMLPVGAGWMVQKIERMEWPAQVRTESMCEPLTSASAVWNRMLAHWQRLRSEQALAASGAQASTPHALPPQVHTPPSAHPGSAPMPLADTGHQTLSSAAQARQSTVFVAPPEVSPTGKDSEHAPAQAGRQGIQPRRALAVLDELTVLDGLIFVALVDGNTGLVKASPARGPDIDRAALAASEIWKTHRRTLRQLGHSRPGEPLEEILVTAGSRYHILRTLRAHPDLFILAVLDKLRSNLAMTRYRIMEAQQVLT
ncbi:hypothetical protein [Sphaerotilus sp.]|uniref:hypothetical protein n=1 Tax=Sphaerotilus sp. TaxID=2093942 RepID=UPI002ACE92A9|nr:hypothetical protein [Sphaerotilus sp.]MDZ7854631.1 hypothetical protein [Sphaerotilus sp.]